ncbi:MAG: ATP-binding cassette domain-containing protein, partial [Methylocystaceae bacterium]
MIEIKSLSFKYDADQSAVLKSLDLNILGGEYTAVIGPNGSGKTTLIRHLNALLLPSSGDVNIDGLSTRSTKNHLEIRRRVGMIFQNPDSQIVGMSVEEDVAFGPGNLGLPPAEIRRRVDRSLAAVGLAGLEKHPPYTLSGGQKQLLALAGLLAMSPRYIVLDEPTASLDPEAKGRVLRLLRDLRQNGIGIIHVTHSMDEAALADRVIVLAGGQLAADGEPREVLSRMEFL